jgi:hypothetical protein
MPQQAEGKRVMLQTSEGEVRMHSRSTPWTRRGVAASVTLILAIAALAGPAPAPVAAQSPADTLHAAGGRDTNAGLQAHPDTFRLQEVVVTATRCPSVARTHPAP